MRNTIRNSIAATALTMTMLASGTAFAYQPSTIEKAELAQLTPALRGEVTSRLTGEQTVRGVLETMLLNNVSLLYATNRVVAVDFDKGVAVFSGKDGQIKSFPFDITTLVIKN